MAAIDIIRNMGNQELLNYYSYCAVKRLEDLKLRGFIETYHPDYKHNVIYVGKKNIPQLHYPNEMFLLSEMWDRFINGSFMEQCWWKSKNPWSTKIAYSTTAEENIKPTIANPPKKDVYITYNNEQYKYIGSGSKRKTYLSPCGTFVIKIPYITNLGYEENKREFEMYRQNPNSIYAKCSLLDDGYLKMEYVKPLFLTKDDDYPDWVDDIAEAQVGYNLQGKLVAYDYGSDI